MKKLSLLVIVAFSSIAFSHLAQSQTLDQDGETIETERQAFKTFTDMIKDSLKADPTLLSEKETLSGDKEAVRESRAGYLPKIDVTTSASKDLRKINTPQSESSYLKQNKWSSYPTTSTTVTLSQPIFDGFKTNSLVDSRTADVDRQSAKIKRIRNERILAAGKSVANLQFARERVKIISKTYKDINSLLEISLQRTAAKLQSESDQGRVEYRVLEVARQLREASAALKQAEASFEKETGFSADLAPPIDTPEIPQEPLDSMIDASLSENPIIDEVDNAKRARQYQVGAERSAYYPYLSVDASGGRSLNSGGSREEVQDASLMVKMTWNIYSGGADTAKVRQAKTQLSSVTYYGDDIKRRLIEQIKTSYADLLRIKESLELSRDSLEISKRNTKYFLDLFAQGMQRPLDVADVMLEYMRSELTVKQLESQDAVARSEFLVSLGKLSDYYGIEE